MSSFSPEHESRPQSTKAKYVRRAATRPKPISEIELELKNGDSAALYDFALRLLEVAPISIAMESKAERGYRLIGGAEAAPHAFHAEPLAFDPEMTVDSALQEIGRSCLTQALRNQHAVVAGDPEGIHQMRVAFRRLRSAVSSFKNMLPVEDRRWVNKELRSLGGALGQARNFDVFSSELLPSARTGMGNGDGWDELAGALDRLRRSASNRAREAVLSAHYTDAMLHLARWFEIRGWQESAPQNSPIRKIAEPVLDRRRHKLRQRSKRFNHLNPRER